jgi:hypothetical protein
MESQWISKLCGRKEYCAYLARCRGDIGEMQGRSRLGSSPSPSPNPNPTPIPTPTPTPIPSPIPNPSPNPNLLMRSARGVEVSSHLTE